MGRPVEQGEGQGGFVEQPGDGAQGGQLPGRVGVPHQGVQVGQEPHPVGQGIGQRLGPEPDEILAPLSSGPGQQLLHRTLLGGIAGVVGDQGHGGESLPGEGGVHHQAVLGGTQQDTGGDRPLRGQRQRLPRAERGESAQGTGRR
ncbi:hypothetical protein RB199_25145 [Streptomyces libani]